MSVHIELLNEIGFGKTVLLPGDPLRSKFIAENFLSDAVLVNNIRGVNGYTGFYKGVKVSVMASGMGMPAVGIYSYELYKFFGVENIIRVGSAGSISSGVDIRDIVIGMGACTDSSFALQYGLNGTIAPICDYELLSAIVESAQKTNARYHIGNLFSTDRFYDDKTSALEWERVGCLAVEMEDAALYCTAQNLKKRAVAVCTVSDKLYPPFDRLSPADRESSFTQMIEIALEATVKMEAF